MKNIMVTGGAGYVGSILLRRLLDDGYGVVCVDTLKFGGESILDIWEHPNFTFYKTDVADAKAMDKIMADSDLHGVIHLAAIVGDPACKLYSDEAHNTNWGASVYLVDKCKELGIERFIFASTCSNYGKMADPEGYVVETSPLAPISLYAELKVKFENYFLKEMEKTDALCPTSLRFSTVYGMSPRMRFDLTVNEFTKDLALGKELVIFGEQFWRPYCHVADFTNAMMTVLEAPKEKVAYDVFNVGETAENYTKKMLANELDKLFPEANIKYVKKDEDPRDYRADHTKIKEQLGFKITKTVPEGMREIKEIVELGVISDPEGQQYYNIPHKRS
ncbi:NAD-dependent epimerase/dehydratase family protein [Maridesulfovibrio frigidus]|uniref:NAD-dependent epimerase/dehydratase family protein n=1 Tax=Maridesulfovibrio frigidus TaxID=340956 RepID=UPI0004E21E28|nr:NAD-dependent epimerase/dehydratase family protein [Maridesulfovibrio frigidus]